MKWANRTIEYLNRNRLLKTDRSNSSSKKTIKLKNRHGMHLGLAAEVTKIASAYEASIMIILDERRADARSLFDLLVLDIAHGQQFELLAEGDDAKAALNELIGFLDSYRDKGVMSKNPYDGLDSFAA